MGWGTKAGINWPKMRLLFSLGKEICRRRLWKGASLSIGSSDGGMWRGGSFTGDFERQVIEASLYEGAMQGESRGTAPLLGTLKEEPGRGGSFTGDSERHVEEGFVKGISLLYTGCTNSVERNLEVGLLY